MRYTPDEQRREPERRSRADLKWTISRRRPVTASVRLLDLKLNHNADARYSTPIHR